MSITASLQHDLAYVLTSAPDPKHNWLVFGDSWSAAREADTGLDGGWPRALGIPGRNRFARSGSTARDWAGNRYGRLSEVRHRATETTGPIVFSLAGNDIRHAATDGIVSPKELWDVVCAVRSIVRKFPRNRHLVVLMYADPYFGKDNKSKRGVWLMNRILELATLGRSNVQRVYTSKFFKPSDFNGSDFHPTVAGWKRFAPWLENRVLYWRAIQSIRGLK